MFHRVPAAGGTPQTARGREALEFKNLTERKTEAAKKIGSMFSERRLLYFKNEGLLEGTGGNWIDVGHYTLLLPPMPRGKPPSDYQLIANRVQLYVDTQEKIIKTDEYPEGMFLVRLGPLLNSLATSSGSGSHLYATYIQEENKFYLKWIGHLRSYARKVGNNKKTGKRSAVLLKPKDGSRGADIANEAYEYNGMNLILGDYSVKTKNALHFTEEEFLDILDQSSEHISNYPGDLRLGFKLMAKTLTRR